MLFPVVFATEGNVIISIIKATQKRKKENISMTEQGMNPWLPISALCRGRYH